MPVREFLMQIGVNLLRKIPSVLLCSPPVRVPSLPVEQLLLSSQASLERRHFFTMFNLGLGFAGQIIGIGLLLPHTSKLTYLSACENVQKLKSEFLS